MESQGQQIDDIDDGHLKGKGDKHYLKKQFSVGTIIVNGKEKFFQQSGDQLNSIKPGIVEKDPDRPLLYQRIQDNQQQGED